MSDLLTMVLVALVGLPLFELALFLCVHLETRHSLSSEKTPSGELGEATTALSPKGFVFYQGESWSAESSAPVQKGEKVRVVEKDGLLLRVEPLKLDQESVEKAPAIP